MSDQENGIVQSFQTRLTHWMNEVWNELAPYYKLIKKILIISIVAFNVTAISLCISSFLFGTIYFYHMPTISHTLPLYFHYNRSCMQQHKIVEHGMRWDRHLSSVYTHTCYPVAKVQLSSPKTPKLLQEGQVYSVIVNLELPETPSNLAMGMFMVNMTIEGVYSLPPKNPSQYRWSKKLQDVGELDEETSNPMITTTSKAISLPYKSSLMRDLRKLFLWPLFMFDFLKEAQTLDEVLFSNLMLEKSSLNWTASVYLEHPSIDVYSGKLDIVAEFSGIQHILYRWPILSFCFGTAFFFLPVVFTVIIMFFCCVWWPFFSTPTTVEGRPSHRRQHRRRAPIPNPEHDRSSVNDPSDGSRQEPQAEPTSQDGSCVANQSEITEVGVAEVETVRSTGSRRGSSSSIEMLDEGSAFSLTESQSSYVVPSLSSHDDSDFTNGSSMQRLAASNLVRRRQPSE